MRRIITALVVGASAVAFVPALITSSAAAAPTPSAVPAARFHASSHGNERTCATAAPGHAACFARVVTGATGKPLVAATPAGYGPSSIRSAYALNSASSGSKTVAIVDAYNDPTAASDLDKYRSTYGLPACTATSGCFKKVSQTGSTSSLPATDAGWATEISLDLDMVSAACPDCKILLVEAKSTSSPTWARP